MKGVAYFTKKLTYAQAIINTYYTIVHGITLRTLRSAGGVVIMKKLKWIYF